MTYLLDTDMVIFMIRGLKSTSRRRQRQHLAMNVVDRCRQAQREGHSVGVSAITVSELDFGARNSSHYETEIAAVQKILLPFDTFDYDAVNCPLHYGCVRHELEEKGAAIGAMDLFIAAHALSLEATLVTNNTTHFGRVTGLNVVNWADAARS